MATIKPKRGHHIVMFQAKNKPKNKPVTASSGTASKKATPSRSAVKSTSKTAAKPTKSTKSTKAAAKSPKSTTKTTRQRRSH